MGPRCLGWYETPDLLRTTSASRPQVHKSVQYPAANGPAVSSAKSCFFRSGLIKGDFDWIVLKALEKDRNRRYETAAGTMIGRCASGTHSPGVNWLRFARRVVLQR